MVSRIQNKCVDEHRAGVSTARSARRKHHSGVHRAQLALLRFAPPFRLPLNTAHGSHHQTVTLQRTVEFELMVCIVLVVAVIFWFAQPGRAVPPSVAVPLIAGSERSASCTCSAIA